MVVLAITVTPRGAALAAGLASIRPAAKPWLLVEPMVDRCASYNADTDGLPAVALPKPAWSDRNGDTIMVDSCIAKTVRALWAAGHITLSSCCGHGNRPPSLVLGNGDVDLDGILAVIAEVDGRRFDLHQWQLVQVTCPNYTATRWAATSAGPEDDTCINCGNPKSRCSAAAHEASDFGRRGAEGPGSPSAPE